MNLATLGFVGTSGEVETSPQVVAKSDEIFHCVLLTYLMPLYVERSAKLAVTGATHHNKAYPRRAAFVWPAGN